jgi:hypothetical protein
MEEEEAVFEEAATGSGHRGELFPTGHTALS